MSAQIAQDVADAQDAAAAREAAETAAENEGIPTDTMLAKRYHAPIGMTGSSSKESQGDKLRGGAVTSSVRWADLHAIFGDITKDRNSKTRPATAGSPHHQRSSTASDGAKFAAFRSSSFLESPNAATFKSDSTATFVPPTPPTPTANPQESSMLSSSSATAASRPSAMSGKAPKVREQTFPRPLVIHVRSDAGPSQEQVSAAREKIIRALKPEIQKGSFGKHVALNSMRDVELFHMVLPYLREPSLSQQQLQDLRSGLDTLRAVVAGSLALGGAAARKGHGATSAATVANTRFTEFEDENLLHEMKASALDIPIVVAGDVEVFRRVSDIDGTGAEARRAAVARRFEPSGGPLLTPEEVVKDVVYVPALEWDRRKKAAEARRKEEERRRRNAALAAAKAVGVSGKPHSGEDTEQSSAAASRGPTTPKGSIAPGKLSTQDAAAIRKAATLPAYLANKHAYEDDDGFLAPVPDMQQGRPHIANLIRNEWRKAEKKAEGSQGSNAGSASVGGSVATEPLPSPPLPPSLPPGVANQAKQDGPPTIISVPVKEPPKQPQDSVRRKVRVMSPRAAKPAPPSAPQPQTHRPAPPPDPPTERSRRGSSTARALPRPGGRDRGSILGKIYDEYEARLAAAGKPLETGLKDGGNSTGIGDSRAVFMGTAMLSRVKSDPSHWVRGSGPDTEVQQAGLPPDFEQLEPVPMPEEAGFAGSTQSAVFVTEVPGGGNAGDTGSVHSASGRSLEPPPISGESHSEGNTPSTYALGSKRADTKASTAAIRNWRTHELEGWNEHGRLQLFQQGPLLVTMSDGRQEELMVSPRADGALAQRWQYRQLSARSRLHTQIAETLEAREQHRARVVASPRHMAAISQRAEAAGRLWSVSHGTTRGLKKPAGVKVQDMWTTCCGEMAFEVAERRQRQDMYQRFADFMTSIDAPHTHLGVVGSDVVVGLLNDPSQPLDSSLIAAVEHAVEDARVKQKYTSALSLESEKILAFVKDHLLPAKNNSGSSPGAGSISAQNDRRSTRLQSKATASSGP